MFDRIVLNIPHSSPTFPFGKECWEDGVDEEILRWTDWYTDWLFQSPDARVISVSYPFSRFFCDVERLEDDPLESIGQGIVYTRFKTLKRSLSTQDESWARRTYCEHIEHLRAHITDGRTLLLDCHSFPSDLSDVEVCIGFNDDWSRPSDETIDTIISAFNREGYKIGINRPYSNSIAPTSRFAYKSVMIELNKSTYMDDLVRMNVAKAGRIRKTINELYSYLLSLRDNQTA